MKLASYFKYNEHFKKDEVDDFVFSFCEFLRDMQETDEDEVDDYIFNFKDFYKQLAIENEDEDKTTLGLMLEIVSYIEDELLAPNMTIDLDMDRNEEFSVKVFASFFESEDDLKAFIKANQDYLAKMSEDDDDE